MRLLLAVALLALTGGCAEETGMLSLGSLQFSQQAEALPPNYRAIALKALIDAHLVAAKGQLELSGPGQMVGVSINDPMRWYVCARTAPTVQATVVFDPSHPAAVNRVAADAPLCSKLAFQPAVEPQS